MIRSASSAFIVTMGTGTDFSLSGARVDSDEDDNVDEADEIADSGED